ncbi:MAG: hypothetical protein LBF42_00680 [Puniceicoccales bacterium]|jgi:hypothetical protein|nr:hypothetical protein [Puniceicoccales bacterium]
MDTVSAIKSKGEMWEIYSTKDKAFEPNPLPNDFRPGIDRAPPSQVNVFRLPERSFIKSFRSLKEFFTENPEMLPDCSLKGYCKITNALLNRSYYIIYDAEEFKQEHARWPDDYDVSSVHEPRLEDGKVVYFITQGANFPSRITISKPFYGPEAKFTWTLLPPIAVPMGKQV